MWPFTSSSDDELIDEEVLNKPVIQTSIDPSLLPYLDPEPEPPSQQSRPYYRLGYHPVIRIGSIVCSAGAFGFLKGFQKGAHVAVLCYRAENAHLTPTSKAGWYLYNKSKNYHAIIGGTKQGLKTGGHYFGWLGLFFALEGGLDAARGRLFASREQDENDEMGKGQADFINTVSAAVAVAGIYGWRTGMDRFNAGRLTNRAVLLSVPFGLGQDLVAWLRGQNTWYMDSISRLIGSEKQNSAPKLAQKIEARQV